jgi:tetratricopeptide (TPR) repeat protein
MGVPFPKQLPAFDRKPAPARKIANTDESLFERARLLTERGEAEQAKLAYLELLTRSPGHFGALNNLGALLHDMGYRTAAGTAYAQAVACHPRNPTGHVNLANTLREAGDLARAREHCETALALAPDHAAAHQALANVLSDCGDEGAAERHRRTGYGTHSVISLPYRGTAAPVSLLLLVSAVGGNIPIRHLLDDRIFRTSVIHADYWNAEIPLPPHDLVFNTIGDADLCRPALQNAACLLERCAAPVLNHPAAVLRSGRAENACRLAHLPGVRTGKTVNLPRAALCGPDAANALAESGLGLPLLLRTPGFHTGRHFLRVDAAEDIAATVATLPGKELTAIEYLDARGADGNARKYRVMFVNGNILPLHLAISRDWKVHYFTADMADNAEHRAEENRFLADMPGVIGARGMAALEHIRDTLGLDYAGIDFGLNADGEVLLFEANATMVIIPPDGDARWDYRREAIARIQTAVRAMLAQKAEGRLPRARERPPGH